MITSPQIEKFAFEGKCRWAVQWFGVSSAGTIQCPEGGFILMRQIIYRPFVQPDPGRYTNPYVHQLTLSEQGATDELQYIFRNSLTDTNTKTHMPTQDGETIETWAIYKRNIEIDLINAPDSDTFTYAALAQFSPEAQERSKPLGFGCTPAGFPITNEVTMGGAEVYYPSGQQRPIAGLAYSGANIRDRLRFNVTVSSGITPVGSTNSNRNFQYPIIGFGMWIFNIPVSEYLNY